MKYDTCVECVVYMYIDESVWKAGKSKGYLFLFIFGNSNLKDQDTL